MLLAARTVCKWSNGKLGLGPLVPQPYQAAAKLYVPWDEQCRVQLHVSADEWVGLRAQVHVLWEQVTP